MANHLGVPGISGRQLSAKRFAGEHFILLDVRERNELLSANLGGNVTNVPLSLIAQQYEMALPEDIRHNKDAEIVVMCHHGIRSAQVTGWMRDSGFRNVWNLDGGIDAYASEIDPTIGRY